MIIRFGDLCQFRLSFWPTAGFLFFLSILLTLGFWQLQRETEKKELLAKYAARQQQSPISLTALQEEVNDIQFQSIQLVGSYDNRRQFLLDNRYYQRRLGYYVLTPFKPVSGTRWVLINRGWIPRGTRREELPQLPPIQGIQHVEGIVYQPPQKVFKLGRNIENPDQWPQRAQQRDMASFSRALGKDVYPFIVRLNADQPHGFVRDWPIVTLPPERHRAYAIQWFALALVLSVIYCAVNVSFRREH